MEPRQFEAQCYKTLEEYDRTYFGSVGSVIGIRLTRFARDYEALQQFEAITRKRFGLVMVTLGMYDSESRLVYLNYHVRHLVNKGYFTTELRAVLYHELIHAVLCNAHQPIRLGLYRCYSQGGHGPAFQKLWNSNNELREVNVQPLCSAVWDRMEKRL